ncbi:hypothetical protein ABZ719_31890 [Streptomyces sp. NPDC006743]|uniref:hypothetical protein n=1 Tax=Streptomyces sp. NPDC006743 TaxID=3154480 RepID=UPI0034562D64
MRFSTAARESVMTRIKTSATQRPAGSGFSLAPSPLGREEMVQVFKKLPHSGR